MCVRYGCVRTHKSENNNQRRMKRPKTNQRRKKLLYKWNSNFNILPCCLHANIYNTRGENKPAALRRAIGAFIQTYVIHVYYSIQCTRIYIYGIDMCAPCALIVLFIMRFYFTQTHTHKHTQTIFDKSEG